MKFQQQQAQPFQSVPRPPGSPNNRPSSSSSNSNSNGFLGNVFSPFFPNKKREVAGNSIGPQKPISLKEFSNNIISLSTGTKWI